MTRFTAEVHQNEYLAIDGSEVNAVVTVATQENPGGSGSTNAAEIVIVDTSGSMRLPQEKIRAAVEATAAALDCLRDGVAFGVIAGTDRARALYPTSGQLVPASAQTRVEAKEAVGGLKTGGGTAIGTWLTLANEMFGTSPGSIHHAILLTDGQNQDETPEELDRALATCEGNFQCDCRGIGTDWEVSELRRVATALLGTVDIIAQPSEMPADFRSMIEKAMGKATNNVSLRLWRPRGAAVAFVKQVSPSLEDLTDRAVPIDALTADYPTGAWGEETREYQVCIRVEPREVGDEMLAGRVSLVVDDEVATQALIKATWSDDEQLTARIDREVAHFTGQAALAQAIQEGLEARKSGDEETATSKLGRAVRLASEGGNDATMKLLSTIVEVDDPATGSVRLKREVDEADEMALDTRSTKTVRVQSAKL